MNVLRLVAFFALSAGPQDRRDDSANGDYGGYHTWPEILEKIAGWKRARPGLVHETSIGKTLEGRDIVALRISDNAGKDEDEPAVLLMAGIHPREQPAQVLLLRLVDEILEGYGRDARLTRLVDEREIWIIPCFNVDGKVYDMKHGNGTDHGAEWRKNRRPNEGGTTGVDLNRQWPVRWGGSTDLREKPKVTLEPKSDYFVGWGPMEEPENRALDDFFRRRAIRAFVDIHSPFKAIYFPTHLAGAEYDRYTKLARELRERQKVPYALTRAKKDEDAPAERGGDCGLSYDWAYYVHGATAFIFEIFADPKWYPPLDQIGKEYANFRDPMLHVIEEAAGMPLPGKGTASIRESKTDLEPAPGATLSWMPVVEGACEYGVLVSESAAVRVVSEYRGFPLKSGFALGISPDAKPGSRAPMALYLWDRERRRSVARFDLTVGAAVREKVRVGIYDFGAEGGAGPANLEKCLGTGAFEVRRLKAADIREGTLSSCDVLLVPGGSGSAQAKELEAAGCEAVRKFVDGGGGYVGFCAGAYLASSHYPWSLGILDAKVIDTEHWARGTGVVKIRLTKEGRRLMGTKDEWVEIEYAQGPLLGPGGKAELSDFETLATYETEIAKKGAPEGVMKGTVAVAAGSFGRGRVFCFSPHPEKTAGLEGFVIRAVRWSAGRD